MADADPAAAAAATAAATRRPINVVVPMGGLGQRFSRSGYRFPKPIVKILGRPMIYWLLDRLSLQPGDTLFVALLEDVDAAFSITAGLRHEFHKTVHIKPVLLSFETGGAAETLFAVLQTMTADELARPTISLDCDTFYFEDILSKFRALSPNEHATFYFEDSGDAPVFSYIQLQPDGLVSDVREKIAISRHANTGAYGFASAQTCSTMRWAPPASTTRPRFLRALSVTASPSAACR